MLGTTRFILACLVALSHVPGVFLPYNYGVSSVIGFYAVSGYLMRKSYPRFRENSPHPLWAFYRDRFFKIIPAYAAVLALTWLCVLYLGDSAAHEGLRTKARLSLYFYDFSSFPASWFSGLVPPSWSLTSEVQFYLLVPLLAVVGKRFRLGVFFLAIAVQCIGLSLKDAADPVAYRFIGGVLPAFLIGFLLAAEDRGERGAVFFGWMVYLGYALFAFASRLIEHVHAFPVLLGLIAAPYLLLASATPEQRPQGRLLAIDDALGNLSYPLFLVHFLAMFLLEKTTPFPTASTSWFAAYIVLCLVLSAAVHGGLQDPVERWRIRSRGFASIKPRP